jgi:hypothetical protein
MLREIGIADWQYMINVDSDKIHIYFPPECTLDEQVKQGLYELIETMPEFDNSKFWK